MRHKLIISKMLIFFLYICIATASSIPMEKAAKVRRMSNETNSFNVSYTARLAKTTEMKNYMNKAVDPCTDFYEFACGNWAKINPPETVKLTGYLYDVINAMKHKKLELLKLSPSSNDTLETPIEKKVRDFYRSCSKGEGVKQSTYKSPLLNLIAEFGAMPALDIKSWNSTQFDWMSAVAQIKSNYGISIILHTTIMNEMKNNTMRRLYFNFNPPFHLEAKSMYLDAENQKYRDDYRDEIMYDLVETMDMTYLKARNIANEILNFEIELAKGLPDQFNYIHLEDKLVPTTVENMHKKYAPIIDIKRYVLINFGKIIEGPIYESNSMYMENLIRVINATNKEAFANYIFYRLLTELKPEKTDTEAAHMKYCEKLTEIFFSPVLENMVYKRFDSSKIQNDIISIFNELKKGFRAKLTSNDLKWLSLKTRQIALKKLDAMRLEISSYMEMNFTKRFGDIQIDESDFFENLKNIKRNIAKREKGELFNPNPDKSDGEANSLSYDAMENVVKVPVTYLQPNYTWSGNYPQALKFGSIGALIGHEIIHGFDDVGGQFDEYGNLNNWWDEESMAEFQNRTECFKDQYHQYRYGGNLLPRAEDQSENIADNAGLRLAFEAYVDWYTAAAKDYDKISIETLPELNYSAKQLFFMSFGQIWCTEVAQRYRAEQVTTDEHMPPRFRVIGTLSNYDEFSKAFNCNAVAAMNPKKKCVMY